MSLRSKDLRRRGDKFCQRRSIAEDETKAVAIFGNSRRSFAMFIDLGRVQAVAFSSHTTLGFGLSGSIGMLRPSGAGGGTSVTKRRSRVCVERQAIVQICPS